MSDPNRPTSSDLDSYLPAIVAGDTRAFGQWMARSEYALRDSLRSFAAQVDTESVVQEAFLRIWQVAPRFRADGRKNGLLRLAFRIARNLAISETRRLRTASAFQDDLEHRMAALERGGGPRPPDPMLRTSIDQCRESLPEKPKKALSARLDSAGARHDAELASQLGMTKNTFLQNITRARKFLAQCLEQRGVDLHAELAQ